MQGRITDVYVSLKGLTHSTPGDLDILLVAPSGRASILMSDACVGQSLSNRTFTFHQQATRRMPQVGACSEFFYRPSNYETAPDSWVDAPQVNHPADLDTFIGDDPNGMWRLMILDDDDKYDGKVSNGWSLTVETKVPDAVLPGSGRHRRGRPVPDDAHGERPRRRRHRRRRDARRHLPRATERPRRPARRARAGST